MALEEIQKNALGLTDAERASLAAELLSSLPGVLVEEDDGIAEARKRFLDLDENPDAGLSWEEIKSGLGR